MDEIERLAHRHLDGDATPRDREELERHLDDWVHVLEQFLHDTDAVIQKTRGLPKGWGRTAVLDDFSDERTRIAGLLEELTGVHPDGARTPAQPAAPPPPAEEEQQDEEPGTVQLQLSWSDRTIVAWAGGHNAETADLDGVLELLAAAGVGTSAWSDHDGVRLPDGARAAAATAPLSATLGWLVSLGAEAHDPSVGTSVTWIGRVAAMAVRQVALGRMVPRLTKASSVGRVDSGQARGGRGDFVVTWEPALVDPDRLAALTRSMPGAVTALGLQGDAKAVTQTILGDLTDAICADAASRIDVPAPPPRPRSTSEVAEAVLARLDGEVFEAPVQNATELGRAMQRWARPVTGTNRVRLVLQLDPPDELNAWHLRTHVADGNRKHEHIDAAMSNSSSARRELLKRHMDRLEILYPPLQRGRSRRRGEVILSQNEAWELMAEHGPTLTAAGFDVRVPPLSRRKAKPGLKLTSFGTQGESVVGAQQLTAVRWSAVIGDVELDARDIRRLAQESRPLVRAHGRWVEVDHADLEAAAQALAERARGAQELTGAEMLRYAMGLESSDLGQVALDGDSWASALLASANDIPEHPPTSPEGFDGELRAYQADALAWLEFLDGARLGGCLALDMGLGKTPTMLAHLNSVRDKGPALVIAPPAVVGNWASEARRFVPGMRMLVHHGASRAQGRTDITNAVESVDLVITTYGTALRDIEALSEITFGKVVLDEAQIIKNHTSETAQQLRRLRQDTRLVLTGTPIENGLGDLWSLMDFVNPGLVGERAPFVAQLSKSTIGSSVSEQALRTLNGVLVFRRTKAEPSIAAELPDRIDELDHCPMTDEQIGLYQAILDELVRDQAEDGAPKKKGAVLAAITALKQVCNHPAAYTGDDGPLEGRSGKLARLDEIVDQVFASGERMLIFTHFARWGDKLATHLTERKGIPVGCYHGGLSRGARDEMIKHFQNGTGPGALVLSLKAGGTGLNLTAASHVVLYDRWWNPAVEDQARDRAWRIGQTRTVVAHRLVCPGTVDERVEEVVQGKRRIANLALPKSSTVNDLSASQLQQALGLDTSALLTDDED